MIFDKPESRAKWGEMDDTSKMKTVGMYALIAVAAYWLLKKMRIIR